MSNQVKKLIVFLNSKGGVGKSTLSNVLARMLLWDNPGLRIGIIDANGEQGTTRRLQHRRSRFGGPTPAVEVIGHAWRPGLEDAKTEDTKALDAAIMRLQGGETNAQIIIIDTPGAPDDGRTDVAEDAASTLLAGRGAETVIVTPTLLTTEAREQIGTIVQGLDSPVEGPVGAIARRALEKSGGRWVVTPNQTPTDPSSLPWAKSELDHLQRLSARMGFELHSGIGFRYAYQAAAGLGFTPIDMSRQRLESLVGPFDYEGVLSECRSLARIIVPELSVSGRANGGDSRLNGLQLDASALVAESRPAG